MTRTHATILTAALAVLAGVSTARAGGISWRHEVKYVGTWDIQPNGDVKAVRTFTVPAMLYTGWKANNAHMKEMRGFNPAVSTVKVDDLDYKWDDVKRTLTLTMTVRGLCVNKGDHWEAAMAPGVQFSNIDQSQKKAYFHAAIVGEQVTVNGQDVVSFPPAATDIASADAQTLRFKLPDPAAGASGGSATTWWVLFGACLAVGAGLLGLSLVTSRPAAAA